jgi:hypothetical protein
MSVTANYPDYHNQPLKLTTEEIDNPYIVIDEFFQSYHLIDIRACLESWLQDGMFAESIESKTHFSTHEKIAKLVEACWMIRYNLKETDDQKALPISEPVPAPTEVLGKPVQLGELTESKPVYVLKEVFKPSGWCFISNALQDWLFIALSSEHVAYEEAEERQNLIAFNDQLLLLVEALFIITLQNITDAAIKERYHIYNVHLLTKDQAIHPKQVIVDFFAKYPLIYIMRQLDDWLEATIGYCGPWREEITCAWHILDTYRNTLCMIKSANALLNTPNFQP